MPIKNLNYLKLLENEPHPLSPSPKKERGNTICGVFTHSRSPLLLGEGTGERFRIKARERGQGRGSG